MRSSMSVGKGAQRDASIFGVQSIVPCDFIERFVCVCNNSIIRTFALTIQAFTHIVEIKVLGAVALHWMYNVITIDV